MSNYPFLVTSLNRLFQRWLKNPPSPGKVPHLGALNFPSSPAPQNEVSTSRINGDFVYFIFHHLWLVIFWERVYASPIPTGWLHPPFESTDGAHRLVYGLSYWWLIYILILSYHRNHQNPRNTWHINRITLGCFFDDPRWSEETPRLWVHPSPVFCGCATGTFCWARCCTDHFWATRLALVWTLGSTNMGMSCVGIPWVLQQMILPEGEPFFIGFRKWFLEHNRQIASLAVPSTIISVGVSFQASFCSDYVYSLIPRSL